MVVSEFAKNPVILPYETRNTFHARIVSFESATHLCNRRFDPVDTDHFDIAKPQDLNSQPYALFKANYMEVFEHPPSPHEQGNEALFVNGPGSTMDSFDFDNNFAIGVPKILDNQGHLGRPGIHNNMVDNTALASAQEAKCRSRQLSQSVNPSSVQLPTDDKAAPRNGATKMKIEGNTFLYPPENSAPFHVLSGSLVSNYDGTVNSYFDIQMDDKVECDYLIVAISGAGLINFWVLNGQSVVGVDQVPIAGFNKKITNPRGVLTVGVRHENAAFRDDVKTWWK